MRRCASGADARACLPASKLGSFYPEVRRLLSARCAIGCGVSVSACVIECSCGSGGGRGAFADRRFAVIFCGGVSKNCARSFEPVTQIHKTDTHQPRHRSASASAWSVPLRAMQAAVRGEAPDGAALDLLAVAVAERVEVAFEGLQCGYEADPAARTKGDSWRVLELQCTSQQHNFIDRCDPCLCSIMPK